MIVCVWLCLGNFMVLIGLGGALLIWGLYSVLGGTSYMVEWVLMSFSGVDFSVFLVLDWMSGLFAGVVCYISGSVFMYSIYYMGGSLDKRFIYLLMLFVMSMLCVILSPSLLSILLGWDGLGLVSYCLVIYYQNSKSLSGGTITILSNRVGDIGLLIGIVLLISGGGWTSVLIETGESSGISLWGGMSVLFAGLTSSAQVPFSAWLPAAMAAPTPVSSLVHSSTLVTAGVYLFIRFYEMLSYYPLLLSGLLYIAIITMLLAGAGANFETDLKSVVALSTLSQLGLMMGCVSLGLVELAFFHLIVHAMFKALLFLCAGKVIHVVGGYQDLRFMGGLGGGLPVSGICFSVASMSLCGVPFLAGFYSKDLILEAMSCGVLNMLIVVLAGVGVLFTCSYSFRLVYYVMLGVYWGGGAHGVSDEDYNYIFAMSLLLLGAIGGGSFFSWAVFPLEGGFILPLKYGPLLLVMAGLISGMLFIGLTLYYLGWGFDFFISMWFLSGLSGQGGLSGFYALSCRSIMVDLWGELVGPQGSYLMFLSGGSMFQRGQMNTIKVYLVMSLMWLLFVLFGFVFVF